MEIEDINENEEEIELSIKHPSYVHYFNVVARFEIPKDQFEAEDLLREAKEDAMKTLESMKKLPSLEEVLKDYKI